MNKKKFIPLLLVPSLFCIASDAGAKGFFDLFKKNKPNAEKLTAVPGVAVMNPLARYINVEPVGLFAYSENEYYGKAYLVLRVTNFTEKESVFFGSGIRNKKMIAVDPVGNVLNVDASGGYRMDAPFNVTVNIVLDQKALQFEHVDRNIAIMPLVELGINIDASRQGNLKFKNVPVFWDQVPE